VASDTQTSKRAYLDRIERVVTHIHTHLDDPLDLDTLADIACLSRFHWHRVYRAMTGETAAQTVKRLRLQRAAFSLVQSETPVDKIAVQAGYSSQAAFTRAFSAAYGKPPAEFRSSGEHAALIKAHQENNHMAFDIEIKSIPKRTAIGLEHRGAYTDIGRVFDTLFTQIDQHGFMPHIQGCGGLYHDDPDAMAAEELRSDAFVFLNEDAGQPPASLNQLNVGGGSYAVLLYKGPYTSMKPAYDWLFGTWLPGSGREARDGPCIEINLNTPDTTPPAELLTEICVPLED
jgi:AraC family transcriptional regulator